MIDIAKALDKYKAAKGYFPTNYIDFTLSKPLRQKWKYDSWENNYMYTLKDSTNYELVSAGKDGLFDSDDDIIIKN